MARLCPGDNSRLGFSPYTLSLQTRAKEREGDELSIKKWALLWELEKGAWRSQWRTPVLVVILWFSEASELEIYRKTEDSPSETLFKRFGIVRGGWWPFFGPDLEKSGPHFLKLPVLRICFRRWNGFDWSLRRIWIFWRQISFCFSFWNSEQCWMELYCIRKLVWAISEGLSHFSGRFGIVSAKVWLYFIRICIR